MSDKLDNSDELEDSRHKDEENSENQNSESEMDPEENANKIDGSEDDDFGDEYSDESDHYEYPYEDDENFESEPTIEKSQNTESDTVAADANDQESIEDHEDDEDSETEKKMPFLEHLEELRWTIVRSLIAVVVASIVSYIFSKQIVGFLRQPGPEDMKLIFLGPTEGFMIYIKVSLFSGFVCALPVVVYEFWKFIVPGLLEKEKKLVPPIAFFTVMCFAVGAAFAYFVIIPFGLKFLLGFQTEFLEATITIGKYLGFVVTIILVFGTVFELPVLSFFLTKIGILTPEFLSTNRRYGIVLIFIMAAILTPPDIVTQLMLAGPLILLYEVSISVSRMVKSKKDKEENN